MARERKWNSEAERLAAYRAKRTNRTDSQAVQPADDAKRTDEPVRIESEMKPVDEVVQPVESAAGEAGGFEDDENVAPSRDGIEAAKAPPVSLRSPNFVHFRHQPHVPFKLFDGHGRGTVRAHKDGKQYVMVARHDGPDLGELGIVTAPDWQARLSQRCDHGLSGWQCHAC